MTKKELWLRLCDYHFNDIVPPNLWDKVVARFGGTNASTKAFAAKLALKCGWREDFALKAVREYKRFVYLGVVSDFVVTPSEVIDQVWHQHILFSKAYRSFCQDVIAYDFDHIPELIPLQDQTGVYGAQYLDTLELYRQEFGSHPPPAIWGIPKFDEKALTGDRRRSKKKEPASADGGGGWTTDYSSGGPLHQSFDAGESFDGFEGGDFGGGGGGGDWGDSSYAGSDGGGDSGCSSCSSGCGGGD